MIEIVGTRQAHETNEGGQSAAFIIALDCYKNLDLLEQTAGIEPRDLLITNQTKEERASGSVNCFV